MARTVSSPNDGPSCNRSSALASGDNCAIPFTTSARPLLRTSPRNPKPTRSPLTPPSHPQSGTIFFFWYRYTARGGCQYGSALTRDDLWARCFRHFAGKGRSGHAFAMAGSLGSGRRIGAESRATLVISNAWPHQIGERHRQIGVAQRTCGCSDGRMARKSNAKTPSPFHGFNSSPEVIRLAVLMYVRFPLSSRNVEELPLERDIGDGAFWQDRFSPIFAGDIRRHRVQAMRGCDESNHSPNLPRFTLSCGRRHDLHVTEPIVASAEGKFRERAPSSPVGHGRGQDVSPPATPASPAGRGCRPGRCRRPASPAPARPGWR